MSTFVGCSQSASTPPPRPPPLPPPPISCEWTLRWDNPVEDVDGFPLPDGSLTTATLYIGMIPMAPSTETELVQDIQPYGLSWTLRDNPAGLYYYRLTVSNDAGESDPSNETTRECR